MLIELIFLLLSPQEVAIYNEAKTAYEKEEFELARKKIEQSLIRYPEGKHAPAALYLAAKLRRDRAQALDYYKRIVDKYPQSPEAPLALYAIGQYHYANVEYREALEIYSKILSTYPNSIVTQAVQNEVAKLTSFTFIQLGYFGDQNNARRLAKKLKEFSPCVIEDQSHYRVWIGPFSSTKEAEDFMLQKGLKGIIKKLKN